VSASMPERSSASWRTFDAGSASRVSSRAQRGIGSPFTRASSLTLMPWPIPRYARDDNLGARGDNLGARDDNLGPGDNIGARVTK
jgi:hypothetical protein